MTPDIQIDGFSATCLLVTAGICLVAVLVAWYTVRDRIQLSQIILGVFAYVMVMLLENLFDMAASTAALPESGLIHGLYIVLSVVAAREIIRFFAMKYGVKSNFDTTDSAVGFAIGFAGVYLCVCAAYYFQCYTTVSQYMQTGAETFFENVGENSQEAQQILTMVAEENPWQFVLTGVNRAMFLVREIALSVLLWYAMGDGGKGKYFALVPAMHIAAMLPDGLYQAEILTNGFVRDILTCLISGAVAYFAARTYNANEDQVSHFKLEKLRARRRK